MPVKPKSPCSQPGCAALAVERGRCAQHVQAQRRHYDAQRSSPSARGYGYQWERRRAAFLRANPYCEMCGAPATDAHHIELKRYGGSDDDLQALCHNCHSTVTARTVGWGRRR